MQDKLFIISSPNYPNLSGNISIHDLQGHTWVTREKGSSTRKYLKHFICSNGLKVKSLLTINSNQGVKESVVNGIGIFLLSHSVIERELKHGELSIVRLEDQSFMRTFSYVYSPIMKSKRSVETFINVIRSKWPF